MSREAAYAAESRPAFEALQERLLLSVDPLVAAEAPGALAVGPAWFQSVVLTGSGGDPFGAAETVKIDWKGQKITARPNQWIVQFTSEAIDGAFSVAEAAGLLASGMPGLQFVRGLGMAGQVLVAAADADAEAAAAWLGANANVAYFEPNAVLATQAIPNDSGLANLWGLHNTGQSGGTPDADIDAPEAWDLTIGSADVVVGVIDTGIDYGHGDLAANVWTNPGEIPGDRIDNDGNGYVDDVYGWDFVNGDGDPMDDNGHGTHVAGTIGGIGDNGVGVAGVNWQVQVMALKFLDDDGYGSTADAIQALNYATMMRRDYDVNIVATNNSWGGGGYSSSLRAAIAAAGDQGILFVAAAGNDGYDNDLSPHYPSSYDLDDIIAVAATDRNDRLASFSNYGAASVDLAAPGVSIYSTLPGGSYGSYSGTSMATPHVTGVVALLAAYNPAATAADIRTAILAAADPIPAMSGICVTGGRLNAYQALQTMGITGPRVLSVSPARVSPPVSQISVRFTADMVAGSVVPGNFLLRTNGPDDTFDTADDEVFPFSASNLSQPQADRVQIDLAAALEVEEYRLILRGTGDNPLRDGEGQPLNDGSDEIYLFEIVSAAGPYESNDSLNEAADIGLTGPGTVQIDAHIGDGFYEARDVDLFALTVGPGSLITLDVDAYQLGTGLDPVLRLFDADGEELESNDDTHGLDSFIEYGAASGTYYVGVSGYGNLDYDPTVPGDASAGSTGDYRLIVTVQGPDLPTGVGGTVFHDANGNGIRDEGEAPLANWTVFTDLDRNGWWEPPAVATVGATDVPQPIEDFVPVESRLSVSGLSGRLTDVNVTLDIWHTYDRDLEVHLLSPSGTRVLLFSRVGGNGNGFSNTTLDDEAAVSITDGSAPFAGSYTPEGHLGNFDGEQPNGLWTLEISDVAYLDFGSLNAWSLALAAGEPAAQSAADGQYQIAGLTGGTYWIFEAMEDGWRHTHPADGVHKVTIADGQTLEGVDFGNERALPAVVGATINGASRQRSTIRSLAIEFAADVSEDLEAGLLSLFNDTLGQAVDTSAATVGYDGQTFIATWDLSGVPLQDAYYTARLSDVSAFSLQFHRLAGDANGDARVAVSDLGIVGAQYGRTGDDLDGDLNVDGTVNIGDLGILSNSYGNCLQMPAARHVVAAAPQTTEPSRHVVAAARQSAAPRAGDDPLHEPAPASRLGAAVSPATTETPPLLSALEWATTAERRVATTITKAAHPRSTPPPGLEEDLTDLLALWAGPSR